MTSAGTGRLDHIRALAAHEYRCATRSGVLLILTLSMIAITVGSLLISSYDFKAQVDEYAAYLKQAQASGVEVTEAPRFFVLQQLRPVFEYVQIIGAVIAIGLGYLSVARDRSGNTLPLLRSRPVSATDLFFGRLLGATALIATILGAAAVITVLALGTLGGHWLTGNELVRLAIAFVTAIFYMLTFYAIGSWLTARSKVAANGLVVAIVAWLAIVLIVPQIGDTMDPDNQVPGGLFNALQIREQDEFKILDQFKTYETIRSTLEETSLTKHYERFTFAVTGVKDIFAGAPLSRIASEKRSDIIGIAVYLIAASSLMALALRRTQLIREE